MENNKKVNKKNIWIIVTSIVIVAIIATVLIVFKDSLFKQKETFDNDIVIKRIDGTDSLKMPYKYSDIFLTSSSFLEEDILNLVIATASFDIVEAGISWGAVENVLVNTKDKNAMDDLGDIKYCKGITDISTIMSDKRRSSVIFYDGYSEEQFNDSKGYVIIPSSMSKYINEEISVDEKILTFKSSSYFCIYKIIGEYTTKDEYDTIYVSYTNFEKLFDTSSIYISEYVETFEIDINEEKNPTKLLEYLERYFANANMINQYEGKLNVFDEPYMYKFIHSINANQTPSEIPVETIPESSPVQSGQPEIVNEKNIITISRIDGGTDLNMSHVYADMLVNDYMTYLQYIDDIVISTGVMGVDRYSMPLFTNYESYGMKIGWSAGVEVINDPQPLSDLMFHQAVTSTSDIIKNKNNCEIKFYGDYTEKDLIIPREEDCTDFIKGYAIVPTTFNNAFKQYNQGESGLTVTYSSKEKHEEGGYSIIYSRFKPIGEYVTTDKYDTVYLTYAGYNEKYVIEPYRSEYIESIVIETKKDIDITPFLEYLEKYFAPADNVEKYIGENNELDIAYEFCYKRIESID